MAGIFGKYGEVLISLDIYLRFSYILKGCIKHGTKYKTVGLKLVERTPEKLSGEWQEKIPSV